MTLWGSISWDIARAGGLMAYVLLTLSVALGLALSLRWQTPRWPRLLNYELHNFITILSLVFTCVHVSAVWIDPFTRFGWYEIFVPFASHYRPVWMSLGIVGWYLIIAVAVSTWLQRLITYTWWRRLHFATFAVYALSTVHGIATGSDSRTIWAALLYILSTLLIGSLLLLRVLPSRIPRSFGRVATAGALVGSLVVFGAWSVAGPLQPGWNQIANNGQGSGSRIAATSDTRATAQPTSATSMFSQAFQASATGTLTQSGPDANGVITVQIDATLTGQQYGVLRVQIFEQRLQGEVDDDDGGDNAGRWHVIGTRVQLGTATGALVYVGPLDGIGSSNWQALVTNSTASPSRIQLYLQLSATDGSTIQGTVQGQPA